MICIILTCEAEIYTHVVGGAPLQIQINYINNIIMFNHGDNHQLKRCSVNYKTT